MKKDSSCNLGSINLAEFVLNEYTNNAMLDWDSLSKAIKVSVKALDDIIDENMPNLPLEVHKKNAHDWRNIGLGVMGVGTTLFKLGLQYGSEGSKRFVNELFDFLFTMAVIHDSNLAKSKGSFPMYSDKVFDSEIMRNHFNQADIDILKSQGLRNCSLISIAPTGSIATMLGITGGCEPEFAISYTRKTDNLNESYEMFCNEARYYMNKFNTKKLPKQFVCSSDVKWKDRIEMQAKMQNHVDTAISSTVNLPKETPLADVEKLYLYAWELGLKGITIFRDGCKRLGILTTESTNATTETKELKRGMIVEADDNVIGLKRKLITGCGSLHCTAFFDPINGNLMETYFSKGSQGGCNNFMIGLSRMISLLARSGVDIYSIADQLNSCGVCPSYATRNVIHKDTSKGSCCPMAIGNALLDMYQEMQGRLISDEKEVVDVSVEIPDNSPKCPECGEPIVFEGGCNICKSCGWSKCN